MEGVEFWLQHDPDGQHRRAAELYVQTFAPACTREIYHDEWESLAEITCP